MPLVATEGGGGSSGEEIIIWTDIRHLCTFFCNICDFKGNVNFFTACYPCNEALTIPADEEGDRCELTRDDFRANHCICPLDPTTSPIKIT